jgi:hypothetical protein
VTHLSSKFCYKSQLVTALAPHKQLIQIKADFGGRCNRRGGRASNEGSGERHVLIDVWRLPPASVTDLARGSAIATSVVHVSARPSDGQLREWQAILEGR